MEQLFRRILVGLDLSPKGNEVSPGSRRAALQAQWLAERIGASLTFFHSTWADTFEDHDVVRQGPDAARFAALEGLAKEYALSGLQVELVYGNGRPWVEMIQRVLKGENDLVLVARRNDPGGPFPLGSVTRKLLRKCPAPVWVVKPDAPLVHESVLAATDLTPVGARAVELGAFVARSYGCELHVMHAWQMPFAGEMAEGAAVAERLQEEAEAAVEDAVRRYASDVRVTRHVGRDAPSRAIAEGVERLRVDLLVMGTLSRTGIAGLLVGNTAEKLLDRVGCSLFTIKPEGFVSPVLLE